MGYLDRGKGVLSSALSFLPLTFIVLTDCGHERQARTQVREELCRSWRQCTVASAEIRPEVLDGGDLKPLTLSISGTPGVTIHILLSTPAPEDGLRMQITRTEASVIDMWVGVDVAPSATRGDNGIDNSVLAAAEVRQPFVGRAFPPTQDLSAIFKDYSSWFSLVLPNSHGIWRGRVDFKESTLPYITLGACEMTPNDTCTPCSGRVKVFNNYPTD